jgi:hypothetical protein
MQRNYIQTTFGAEKFTEKSAIAKKKKKTVIESGHRKL